MKLRSIGTKLVALVALLIVGTVALVLWQWTAMVRANLLDEARDDARAIAIVLSRSVMNEVDDANWKQVDNNIALMMQDDREKKLVYILIHGDEERHGGAIVVSHPNDLTGYVPDMVSLETTQAAMRATLDPVTQDTWLLRELGSSEGGMRGHRGDAVVEAAVEMKNASGKHVGVVRVAVSAEQADAAAWRATKRALEIGGLVLLIALAGAVIVGRALATPIARLADDAARIAGGELGFRVNMARGDEIGQLANAFDDMSQNLEASFNKLRDTAASFQRFVPQKFLAVVAPAGLENIKIGTAAPRRIAVLFSDIRGFTKMSEQMTPAEVFELLNVYLARMGGAIDKAGGFVDKYIGDAIMALFDDEHTDALLRAVVGMRKALAELNEERAAAGKPPVDTGIGCHSGDVVMGTIGFASKIESTVIGDPVNVGSRVESMTKDYKVAVLITGDVVARLARPEDFKLRLLDKGVAVRGRIDPIDLYTLDA